MIDAAELLVDELETILRVIETDALGHVGDRLLETLSPEDRLALTLIDGEDASVSEVAEMTGWSESKVKVRAFRARRKARETLEKLFGEKLLGASRRRLGLDSSTS